MHMQGHRLWTVVDARQRGAPLVITPLIHVAGFSSRRRSHHPLYLLCTYSVHPYTSTAHQVLVEGPRPNLLPPLRPLADLRKLLLDVRRSLPMSAEVRLHHVCAHPQTCKMTIQLSAVWLRVSNENRYGWLRATIETPAHAPHVLAHKHVRMYPYTHS